MKKEKKFQLLLSALALIFVLSGCRRDNYQWPETVTFGKEGGKQEVSSTGTAHGIWIYERISIDGFESSLESFMPETEATVQYKWLTVKVFRLPQTTSFLYRSIEIEAEPNTTGSPRELSIQGQVRNSRYILQVKQDG